MKDTLEQLYLFFVKRLAILGGQERIRIMGRNCFGTSSLVVPCRSLLYCVLIWESPLSEAALHTHTAHQIQRVMYSVYCVY